MNKRVKIQVPVDEDVRNRLKKRAGQLGFDSSQALLRYVAKSIVEGRRVTFGEIQDDWGEPSDEAAARLNKAAEEAKRGINVSEPFYTVEEMMDHLDKL